MQSELNKYFPNDISTIISRMVYRQMYYEVVKEINVACKYKMLFVFTVNGLRLRWLLKLFYYIKFKRKPYHEFFKKVIKDSKYDFMQCIIRWVGKGEDYILRELKIMFFHPRKYSFHRTHDEKYYLKSEYQNHIPYTIECSYTKIQQNSLNNIQNFGVRRNSRKPVLNQLRN